MNNRMIFTELNLMQIIDRYLLTGELRVAFFDMLSQFTEYQGTLSECMFELINHGFDEIDSLNISRFVGDKTTQLEINFPVVNPLNDVSLDMSEEFYPFAITDANILNSLELNTTNVKDFDFVRHASSLIVCEIINTLLEEHLNMPGDTANFVVDFKEWNNSIMFENLRVV